MSGDAIEITESWSTVDKWWTDEPVRRYFAALRSPSVSVDIRAVVCWDEAAQMWGLRVEPEEAGPQP